MTDGQQIIDRSRTQWGKPYRFGAEVRVGLPWYFQAKAWDCSEFTEGTYGSFGIHLPDGSSVQAGFVKRISIADAERVPGALLGRYPKGGKPGHVVMSMGDGRTTSEAMGTAYGVRQGNIKGRGWQWAGIVPGCAYPRLGIHTPDSPPPPPDGSWAQLQLAINWSKLYRLGNPTADLNENSPGATDAIRFAQAGLNNWYERFARLTKQQPPPPIPVNGQWDQLTRDRINFMQAIRDSVEPGRGHNELGTTGPNFWEAVYPTRP